MNCRRSSRFGAAAESRDGISTNSSQSYSRQRWAVRFA
jgi:hypothetical protein